MSEIIDVDAPDEAAGSSTTSDRSPAGSVGVRGARSGSAPGRGEV